MVWWVPVVMINTFVTINTIVTISTAVTINTAVVTNNTVVYYWDRSRARPPTPEITFTLRMSVQVECGGEFMYWAKTLWAFRPREVKSGCLKTTAWAGGTRVAG